MEREETVLRLKTFLGWHIKVPELSCEACRLYDLASHYPHFSNEQIINSEFLIEAFVECSQRPGPRLYSKSLEIQVMQGLVPYSSCYINEFGCALLRIRAVY